MTDVPSLHSIFALLAPLILEREIERCFRAPTRLHRCSKTSMPLVKRSGREHPNAMKWLFAPLLMLIAKSTESELAKQVEFLKAENQMLRRRIPRQVRLNHE